MDFYFCALCGSTEIYTPPVNADGFSQNTILKYKLFENNKNLKSRFFGK